MCASNVRHFVTQLCLVRLRIYTSKCRLLLIHDPLHEHARTMTAVFLSKQKESRLSTAYLHFHVCCSPAQSLSVYTCTNGGNLLISIKHFALATPFKYLAMRFTLISSHSEEQMISLACIIHAVHDVSTLLAHVQQLHTAALYMARFSFSNLTNDSVVGVLFTLGVAKHGNQCLDCTLDLLLPNFHEPFSRSLCQEETRFYHPIAPLVPQCTS